MTEYVFKVQRVERKPTSNMSLADVMPWIAKAGASAGKVEFSTPPVD